MSKLSDFRTWSQGEAFFVAETEVDETVPFSYVTSPMPTSPMPTSPVPSRPETPKKSEDRVRPRKKKLKKKSSEVKERIPESIESMSDSECGDSPDLEFGENFENEETFENDL